MTRRRRLALGLLAIALAAAGVAAWRAQQTPMPRLRDPARIEAAVHPAPGHGAFIAARQIVASGCTLPAERATPELPAQSPLPETARAFVHDGGTLQPLAGFSVDARVLSSREYRDDREAEFAPIDLALGWGRMRDDDVLSMLEIGQQNRWYYTRWTQPPPIAIDRVRRESANMHMIPANRDVGAALAAITPGQRVRIEGWLVEVQAKDGWRWRSSLRRDDHGPSGCEVVYVCGVALE